MDRQGGLFAHAFGIDGALSQKRRLRSEVPPAVAAMVDADGNEQEHGTIQANVYGRPG